MSDLSAIHAAIGDLFAGVPHEHDAPLVVSYGIGVDSTAMLAGMYRRGIRPDAIVFADTGGEKPETYAYIPVIRAWLARIGFPDLTIVRYVPTRAPYDTLEGKCLSNETLPSLAFGMHSCSLVFKIAPIDKWMESWEPAKAAWAAGLKVRRAIGYDAGKADTRRRLKADRACAKKMAAGHKDAARYEYWYPLPEWDLDREGCIELIKSVGLPVPPKSACFFCPASKKSEIVWLRDTHPVLFHRALDIERGARDGKHGLDTVKGLGRNFAWSDMAEAKAEEIEDEAELLRP
jgi:hypothetical protein